MRIAIKFSRGIGIGLLWWEREKEINPPEADKPQRTGRECEIKGDRVLLGKIKKRCIMKMRIFSQNRVFFETIFSYFLIFLIYEDL